MTSSDVTFNVWLMLDVRNISLSPLFSNLSFSLAQREILLIHGTNGSGKSTLLRMTAGLIQPPLGTIFWEGKKIQLSTYQQNLLYSGHSLGLHPEALLKDQVNLWHYHYRVEKKSYRGSAPYLGGDATYKSKDPAPLPRTAKAPQFKSPPLACTSFVDTRRTPYKP